MRRSRKPIVIASRRSQLARTQAEVVGRALARLHPNVQVQYRWIESQGDRIQNHALASVGGKGLFTQSLEVALLKNEADLAVHSLKDLPSRDTPGLALAAVPRRADVRDCLITAEPDATLETLRQGAVIGTSSPRRAAQAQRLRADLRIHLIRGNVDTRLQKVLDPGQGPHYDATLLAAAGLGRMGLKELACRTVATEQVLPAACQGALALQCRADDHVTLTRCLPLNDLVTATAVHAEREIIASLHADCHSPIAVLCEPVTDTQPPAGDGQRFRLRVRVLSHDGKTCLEADEQAPAKELRRLIKRVVADLVQRDAPHVLAQVYPIAPPPAVPATMNV